MRFARADDIQKKKQDAKIIISTILKKIGNPGEPEGQNGRKVKYLHALRDKWVPNESEVDGMDAKLKILKRMRNEIRKENHGKPRAFRYGIESADII